MIRNFAFFAVAALILAGPAGAQVLVSTAALPSAGGTVTGSTNNTSGPADGHFSSTGNLGYSGTNSPKAFYAQVNAFGSITGAGVFGANVFNVNSDTVDAFSGPGGTYNGYFGWNIDAGATGNRTGLACVINVAHTTANVSANKAYYTCGFDDVTASANDNGTAGTPAGNLFGHNTFNRLTSAATYWNSNVGQETDIEADAGSNVAYQTGFSIVQVAGHRVQGSVDDIGLQFLNQQDAGIPGWKTLISVGGHAGYWPVAATGTILGTTPPFAGGPAYNAANGVDFRSVAFSGLSFASPNFSVSGAGAVSGSAHIAVGSAPTASGTCAINTQVGGNTAGSFKANGACAAGTVVLTFLTTAPNGWACHAYDATTPADTLTPISWTQTSITFKATMASGDLASFGCMGF